MLTDLASVSVVNVLPLSSKSTLRWLLREHGAGPWTDSSFSIWHDVRRVSRGTPEQEGACLPGSALLSSADSFAVCGLPTARLPQHETANSTQGPVAFSCTSPSNVTVSSKVHYLSVDGFPDTLWVGF